MHKLFNKILSKLKGYPHQMDSRVPLSYLFSLSFSRTIMFLRGFCSRIKKDGMIFIDKWVTIKATPMIKVSRLVTIHHHCYIDALSTDGIILGNNVLVGKKITVECTGNLQFIGKGMKVGNNVGLGSDNFFGCAGGIEIGDDTILGNFISFHAENHRYSNPVVPIRLQGVTHVGIKVGKIAG